MAVTRGHGNPNWNRDEIILALDLYNQLGGSLPGPNDARVIALSDLLRSLPYHAAAARNPTFRNPYGVAFKLQNLRSVATGKGLSNVSALDRAIWAEFGNAPEQVRELAGRIRSAITTEGMEDDESSDDEEFYEGRLLFRLHRLRERKPQLRRKLLAKRRSSGLTCDICDLTRPDLPPDLEESLFEAHHVVPLAEAEVRPTRLSDMALLCACCHRAIHRLIALEARWVGISEARTLLRRVGSHPSEVQSQSELDERLLRAEQG